MLVVVDGDGKGRKGESDSDSATSPEGHKSTDPAHWTDPASLIALKATGCDCRKHGYKHIHDLCIADAAKVRPHIVPLVEALKPVAVLNCEDFFPHATCATNDGTGLWCAPCLARRALNQEE
jgi:hypothetical protein